MTHSCDVGSVPFAGDMKHFIEGASQYGHLKNASTDLFENEIVQSFLEKSRTGIDVPNYPQFRDMTEMFLDMIEGVTQINGSYMETSALSLKRGEGTLPEVMAIRNCSQEIREKLGTPFRLRVCLTGPYTLSSRLAYKSKATFTQLGNVLLQIAENNIFSNKNGSVDLVAVDEPVLGFVDDPLLDRGSEGRENLLKAWNSIAEKIASKNAVPCMHLHKTSDELFWGVKALRIIETHVSDSFYGSNRAKELLESTDKFLKASICTTDFDQLIRENILATSKEKLNESDVNEKIAETWRNLTSKKLDPTLFIEDAKLMKKRLIKIAKHFGENRVPYAGPECGLRSFPTVESALECLRRVSQVVKTGSD